VDVLRGLSPADRHAFLNGHLDLAGRLLEAGRVTADSAREQGSAGLDAMNGAARARFLALNRAYRARFGFPFVMAARDRRPEEEILAAFEDRLGRDPAAEEEEEALRQVERVLLLRLRDRC
jgi:2-oxo-4-hydroxy-4-carboxy-5-ureidoimidazoline decarboxylase